MFGLLDLNGCGLTREKRHFYSCKVCDALASTFGRRSRAMLSNDSVYLSLLIAGQRVQVRYEDFMHRNRCQPWSRRSPCLPDFEYPAAVSMLIGGIKLFDDTHDVASFRCKILYALWRSRVRKAEEKLRELGLSLPPVADLVNEQHRREAVIGRELGYYSRISEEVYSKVFSHTATLAGVPSNANHLAKVGLHVGRLAYLLDNYVDLPNDRQETSFNLFSSISSIDPDIVGPDDSKRFLEDQLTQSLRHIQESILRVRLHRFHTSIKHVVAKGLEMKVRKAMATAGTALSAPAIHAYALAGIPLLSTSRLASGESDCCDCSSLCPTPQEICADYMQTTLASAAAHVQEGVIAAVVGGLASLAISSIASHIGTAGSAASAPSPPSTSETGLPPDMSSQSPSQKPWYEEPEPPDLTPDERALRQRLRMRDQMERLGWDVDYELLPGSTPPQYQARAVERYMKCANPACPGKLILRKQLKEDPWVDTSSFPGAVANTLISTLFPRTVCPHCGLRQRYNEPKRYTIPVEG